MWTIQEIEQRVGVINHTQHKQTQARPPFFHRELTDVQKNLDPTVLFPCAESEGKTERDREGGRGKGWKQNNSFFCILWECCLKAGEEVLMMRVRVGKWRVNNLSCVYRQCITIDFCTINTQRKRNTVFYSFILKMIFDLRESFMRRLGSSLHLTERLLSGLLAFTLSCFTITELFIKFGTAAQLVSLLTNLWTQQNNCSVFPKTKPIFLQMCDQCSGLSPVKSSFLSDTCSFWS